jgi:hypothetical protein
MIQVHHFPPNPTIAHFSAQGKKQTIVALCHAHQVLTIAQLIPKITLILALPVLAFYYPIFNLLFPKIWHNNF